MMGTGAAYEVDRVGVFTPKLTEAEALGPGEIGFITASIKEVADTRVGDTITDDRKPTAEQRCPASGRRSPVVFCGLFPVDAAEFEDLRAAMGKLRLNDASFTYEMETCAALGFGFRCGFLGLLHLEIIQERLRARVQPRPDRDRALGDLQDEAHQRRRDRAAQSGRHAGPGEDQGNPGAVDPRHHPDAGRLSRLDPQALPGPARHPGRPHLCRQPRHGEIRPAAQRGGVRFLRPAEIGVEGLRLVRLSPDRLPAGRPGQDADPGQRRAGRRARHAGAPHARRAAAAAWWRSSRS